MKQLGVRSVLQIRLTAEENRHHRSYGSSKVWKNETLTMLQDKKMEILLSKTGPSITVFKTIRTVHKFAFRASQRRHTKSAKIMWLRRLERSRRFAGTTRCLRHENVKLYTLFETEDPDNRKHMGVPVRLIQARTPHAHTTHRASVPFELNRFFTNHKP